MDPILVEIIAAPVACAQGTRDSWRETAAWVAARLRQRFGDMVAVRYYDLFEPACPALPADAQLPLVLLQGQVLSSGGKLSLPNLQRQIQTLMETHNQ